MNLTAYTPTKALRPFVKAYQIIESKDGQVNRVLPGTSFTLAFRIKGQVSYIDDNGTTLLPRITFSGLRKSVRLISYRPQTSTIVVLFKEAGISAFFKPGIHELYEQSVSLDTYFPQSVVSGIEEQLESCRDNGRRIEIIERFLLSRVTDFKEDRLISGVIDKMYAQRGNMRMAGLAEEFHLSKDALEKRFRRITGATPKQFAHIIRMNAVIRRYQALPSFLELAFEHGYYDQPHFNKDFKSFTGQTPTAFFRSASYW